MPLVDRLDTAVSSGCNNACLSASILFCCPRALALTLFVILPAAAASQRLPETQRNCAQAFAGHAEARRDG